MDRNDQLAAKAAEVTESLQEWAKKFLEAGEQLVVTFRLQAVPCTVVEMVDESKQVLLQLNVLDFFSSDRLAAFEERGRVRNCLRHGSYYDSDSRGYREVKDMTLGELLRETTEGDLLRIPNFGRKSLNVVKKVLASEGFSLKQY